MYIYSTAMQISQVNGKESWIWQPQASSPGHPLPDLPDSVDRQPSNLNFGKCEHQKFLRVLLQCSSLKCLTILLSLNKTMGLLGGKGEMDFQSQQIVFSVAKLHPLSPT